MRPFRNIKIFTDRYPLVGPTIWMLCVQYFLAQAVVARAWTTPFSLTKNTISDLGNTACSIYNGKFVCSPLHSLMNASFIMLGLTMAAGSLLIYHEFIKNRLSLIGFSFMTAAGVGAVLVGLFPENTVALLHFTGAGLSFLIGNVGIVLLGKALNVPKALKLYSLFTGALTLTALALFVSRHYLGLSLGGMERVVGYPQTVWLIVFGVYISANRMASQARAKRS